MCLGRSEALGSSPHSNLMPYSRLPLEMTMMQHKFQKESTKLQRGESSLTRARQQPSGTQAEATGEDRGEMLDLRVERYCLRPPGGHAYAS